MSNNNHTQNKSADADSIHSKNETQPTPLILFDKRTKLFLLALLAFYFCMSFLKFHTSSIAIWDQIFNIPDSQSLIAGAPKSIRQDEWMVRTPALIGHCLTAMPIRNMSLGDGNVPVIWGFPFKDVTMILRPSLWPYFILDLERAFSFSWNFNIFFFLISTFLLFLLLTRSNFWLSLLGALFVFFSGAMQWWSYSLGSYMTPLNGTLIALVYLLYSTDLKVLSFAALILLLSSYDFLVGLYPPWQIPLLYLYLSILTGFLIQKHDLKGIRTKLILRIGIMSLIVLALAIFAYHHYGLVKTTYHIILNTAYPGKRITNGGHLPPGKLFSEFFGIFMSDIRLPPKWLNICEASGFIMFFPIVFYGMGYNYLKSRDFDWQQIMLALYTIILLIWLLAGFPTFLSTLSLLSMSPVSRSLPVLGVANCILLICYLGNKQTQTAPKSSSLEFSILAPAVFLFTTLIGNHINKATDAFFDQRQVTLVSLLITAVYLLIRYSHLKYATPLLAFLLSGMNISNVTIHPLTSGLSSLLENPLVQTTKELRLNEPRARWAVFGNPILTNLLKVTGIDVFNGVKVVPILKDMAILDSSGEHAFIYNRFAHIVMASYIDEKDTVAFKLNENDVVNDNYTIFLDPCSPRLDQLGITYLLFTYQPQPAEVRCMGQVAARYGIFIYKREGR